MIKVWSIPTRLMHWLLVGAFGFAFYTRNSEMMRDIHVEAGYIVAAVIFTRILLGFLVRDFSAFRRFPPNPGAGLHYLQSLIRGKAKRYIGHNPAGALAIYAMLFLGTLTVISGYMAFEQISLSNWLDEERMKTVHDNAASAWMLVICCHLLGVFAGSLMHRENLPLAMITGNKVRRLNPATQVRPEIRDITIPEFQRMKYIEEAAYYIAEKHGFQNDRAWEDWLEAEREIDELLRNRGITA